MEISNFYVGVFIDQSAHAILSSVVINGCSNGIDTSVNAYALLSSVTVSNSVAGVSVIGVVHINTLTITNSQYGLYCYANNGALAWNVNAITFTTVTSTKQNCAAGQLV